MSCIIQPAHYKQPLIAGSGLGQIGLQGPDTPLTSPVVLSKPSLEAQAFCLRPPCQERMIQVANEKSEWVTALAPTAGNVSMVPGAHTVDGET